MAASPTGMNPSRSDITLDPQWQVEQSDRLLGFELLKRALKSQFQPLSDYDLTDRIGVHRASVTFLIQRLRKTHGQR